MALRQHRHFFPMLNWIFKMLLPLCAGTREPKLLFFDTVFVGFTGEDLHVHYELNIPANQSEDTLACFDPYNQMIFKHKVPATQGHALTNKAIIQLKMLMSSGEYHCQYKVAKAYWFLRLKDEGYRDVTRVDYTDFIVVACCCGVLLVFSVLSSVYVFRGTWKKQIPDRKQNNERTQAQKSEDDGMGVIIASSTSLYAKICFRVLSHDHVPFMMCLTAQLSTQSHSRGSLLSSQKPVRNRGNNASKNMRKGHLSLSTRISES
ncbi:uncharacterized protein si:ch211-243a20.4 isoform X1 [Hippocampus zosterae]|uniref:uncharacterized protein si:ch211-243a20.4 isoform X1 n=1 Tax=Hippocampus zosterae TaxID=109293 RepID=UPI00223D4F1C|nr:uncharacterized protein si:ch211-243a20.4 isoform X1 [Hippocampus zosterae]